MKFTTQYNYQPGGKNHEPVILGTKTIPNDTYSIKELLEKYSQGIMPDIVRPAQYISEDKLDLINTITSPERDLTDIDNLKSSIEYQKQELTKKQVENVQKQEKREAEAKKERSDADNQSDKQKIASEDFDPASEARQNKAKRSEAKTSD